MDKCECEAVLVELVVWKGRSVVQTTVVKFADKSALHTLYTRLQINKTEYITFPFSVCPLNVTRFPRYNLSG